MALARTGDTSWAAGAVGKQLQLLPQQTSLAHHKVLVASLAQVTGMLPLQSVVRGGVSVGTPHLAGVGDAEDPQAGSSAKKTPPPLLADSSSSSALQKTPGLAASV